MSRTIDQAAGKVNRNESVSETRTNILHVGNILNNGYLHCKYLRKRGIAADSLSVDYPHCQGHPEWVEVAIRDAVDEWHPDWSKVDLGGFERPSWFFDVEWKDLPEVARILAEVARILDGQETAHSPEIILEAQRLIASQRKSLDVSHRAHNTYEIILKAQRLIASQRKYLDVSHRAHDTYLTARKMLSHGLGRLRLKKLIIDYAVMPYQRMTDVATDGLTNAAWRMTDVANAGTSWFISALENHILRPHERWLADLHRAQYDLDTLAFARGFVSEFSLCFPDRKEQLTCEDVVHWLERARGFKAVYDNYKLIHAYALEPYYSLLGNPGQPYICYEHGTMRDFPFQDTSRGKLYALALQKAERVIITNVDCKLSADRLGLKNYRFVPHLIDDDLFMPEETPQRSELKERFGCDYILLAPARHHWEKAPPGMENSWFKRNDILIRGLARMWERRPDINAVCIFFNWGKEVDVSKKLIAELGIQGRVTWMPLVSKPILKDLYNAADIVLDQFNGKIGSFGAVMPEAMACGRPVLLSFREEIHHWCYPELPPVINAPDEEAVAENLIRLFDDPDLLRNVGQAGRRWFKEHHNSDLVVDRIVDIYRDIWDRQGWTWP